MRYKDVDDLRTYEDVAYYLLDDMMPRMCWLTAMAPAASFLVGLMVGHMVWG